MAALTVAVLSVPSLCFHTRPPLALGPLIGIRFKIHPGSACLTAYQLPSSGNVPSGLFRAAHFSKSSGIYLPLWEFNFLFLSPS